MAKGKKKRLVSVILSDDGDKRQDDQDIGFKTFTLGN